MGIPVEVMDAMLLLTSNKVDDLDAGRMGMGSFLYTLVTFLVGKLDLPEELMEPIDAGDGETNPVVIAILDAFFLGCTDPHKAKDKLLNAVPYFASMLLGNVPDEVKSLLGGIVLLFQGDGDNDRKIKAIGLLAGAFGIDPSIVEGLISIAKGDWAAMENMVGKV
ncbi:MAG: hypothetical protein V2I33_23060, partial [Kangiellaceae bacterium]|nr:hypothetical protein [Kangiellaceae bacterium]